MAEAESLGGRASAGSSVPATLEKCTYVGFSFICKTKADTKRVLAVKQNLKDFRTNPKTWTEFTGFIFVQPENRMTKNAFDTWRWRNKIRDLDIILHKSADTAVEGLLENLKAQTDKDGCKHFLPLSGEGASAGELHSVASQSSGVLLSAGGASAGEAAFSVRSTTTPPLRSRFPPRISQTYCVEPLTPLLFGNNELLRLRSVGYSLGEYLGGGSFGEVYKAKSPTGIDVAVKILHKDAWLKAKEQKRTMHEVYVLERCSDLDVHIIRVLDVFLDPLTHKMHIVLELWGESGDKYRSRKGFGRSQSQSTTHIRTLLQHLCCGLSYLHERLGMCHTDVKLANILIIDKFGGFVNDIECKLADVGSVEEVTSLLSPSRTGNPVPPHPTRGLNVHICFQAAPTG
jgi:hypothetical protein